MISKEQAIADLQDSTQKLSKQFAAFDYRSFNLKPENNGWSPGEVAEHLLLLDIFVSKLFAGHAEPSRRAGDEKIATIKSVFANPGRKLDSPDFIRPSEIIKQPQALIEKLLAQRQLLVQSIEANYLYEVCSDFIHPGFGDFTRLEWIYFIIYHTQRHLLQLSILTNTEH